MLTGCSLQIPLDVDTEFCIVHINIYADGKTHKEHNIIKQLIIIAHGSFIKSKLMSSNWIFHFSPNNSPNTQRYQVNVV